jgi:hypothetical protein
LLPSKNAKTRFLFWQSELKRLQSEHRRACALARLVADPIFTWNNELSSHQKSDKQFVLTAIKADPMCFGKLPNGEPSLRTLPPHFHEDPEVLLALLKSARARDAVKIPQSLHDDKEFMIAACSVKPFLLAHVPDRFKDDADVVLSALTCSDGYVPDDLTSYLWQRDAFKHCSIRLKGDEEFLLKAINISKLSLDWLESIPSTLSVDAQRSVLSAIAT